MYRIKSTKKGLRRFGALLLSFALILSFVPTEAWAAEGGLCEHHSQHDESCGYTEGSEGTPCTYVCEICNGKASRSSDETTDTVCTCEILCAEGSVNADCPVCGTDGADLSLCTGTAQEPEADAEPDKAVIKVQELIDALPSLESLYEMGDDDLQAAMEQYAAACEAYEALTDGQKAQVTGAEVLDEFMALMNAGVPLAETAGAFTIDGGTLDTDYSYADGVLTILTGTPLTISQTEGTDTATSDRIVIDSGVKAVITLNGINISSSSSPIDIPSGASADIILAAGSTNTLNGGTCSAGLHVPEGASVVIRCGNHADGSGCTGGDGCGILSAKGGTADLYNFIGSGAGIGGSGNENAGSITIYGGNITATGGSANYRIMHDLYVVNFTATDVGYYAASGAGIGGGSMSPKEILNKPGYAVNRVTGGNGGNVMIHGGVISATGNVGIGGGGGGCAVAEGTVFENTLRRYLGSSGSGSTITITGGTLNNIGTSSSGTFSMSGGVLNGCTISSSESKATGGSITGSTIRNIQQWTDGNITASGSTLYFSDSITPVPLSRGGEGNTYNGNVSLESGVKFGGTTTFNKNVTINTDYVFTETMTIGGNLEVNADVVFEQNLTVNGTTQVSESGSLSVGGTAELKQAATLNGNVTVEGNATFGDTVVGNADFTLWNDATFNSTVELNDRTIINGNATFAGDVVSNSEFTLSGNATFNGTAELNGRTEIQDSTIFNEKVSLSGSLTSSGSITIADDVEVAHNGSIRNNGYILILTGMSIDNNGNIENTQSGSIHLLGVIQNNNKVVNHGNIYCFGDGRIAGNAVESVAPNFISKGDDNGKAIQFHTNGITGYTDTNSYDYIYYGTRSGSGIRWRVLDDQTNFDSDGDEENETGLFVLSESSLGSCGGREHDHRASCNNVYNNNLSALERNSVFTVSYGNNKLFFLSLTEARNANYGFVNNASRKFDSYWYTRNLPKAIRANGTLPATRHPNEISLVRPAFNLDVSLVFFSSSLDGKAANGMDNGLSSVAAYEGVDWKLTLFDLSRTFLVTDRTARTAERGDTITFQYSGAQTGSNEYVSAIISDDQNNILYYGRIASGSESGTAQVTIPDDLALGNYTLRVFSEQYNGNSRTDYASPYMNIPLTVEDNTAPTLSEGTVTRGEGTATVTFNSNEAGSYYYAVVDSGAAAPTINTTGEGTSCDTTEQTITLSGITGSKDIYIVVKDAANNVSDMLKMNIPLIGLSTPENLVWDGSNVSWDSVDKACKYSISLYKDGEEQPSVTGEASNNSYSFSINEVGSYTFTVTAIGDGNNYSDSQPAKSTALSFYEVSFETNGGGTIDPQYIADGGKITKPVNNPSALGLTFNNWYDNASFSGEAWDFENDTVTQSMTLYAKYNNTPKYIVIIPESVTLGDSAAVSASGVNVASGWQLEVALTATSGTNNAFTLESDEKAVISYTVQDSSGGTIAINDTVLTVAGGIADNSGSATLNFIPPETVTYAGRYTGSITFTVSVKDAV